MASIAEKHLMAFSAVISFSWSLVLPFMWLEAYKVGIWELALVRGPPALAYFLGLRLFGKLVDQLNARKPFIKLGVACNTASLIMISAMPASCYPAIAVFWYFTYSALDSALVVLVHDYSGEEAFGRGLGGVQLASLLSVTAGNLIGGEVTKLAGLESTSLLGAVISAASLLAAAGIRELRARSQLNMREAAKWAVSLRVPKQLAALAASLLIASISLSQFYLAATAKLMEACSFSPVYYGAVTSASGLLSGLSSPLYGRLVDKLGGYRSYILSCILYVAYLPAVAATSSPLTLAVLLALPLFQFLYIARTALALKLSEHKGEAYSISSGVCSLSEFIGNLTGSILEQHIGINESILASAAGVAVAPLILHLCSRDISHT